MIVTAIGESVGVPALLVVGWLLLCLAIFRTGFFDGNPWEPFGNLFLFAFAAIVVLPIPRLLTNKANAPIAASPIPFPNTPLQLVDFRPLEGGALLNNSDETLFVTDMGTTTTIPSGEDSTDYPVGLAIKPHQTMSFSLPASVSAWDTQLPYISDDWNAAAKDLTARYGQCLRPLPFLPDSALFQEVVNHYKTMQMALPIGDSKAVIFYHRGASSKEETVQLKALLYVLRNCTVAQSGAGSPIRLPSPPQ